MITFLFSLFRLMISLIYKIRNTFCQLLLGICTVTMVCSLICFVLFFLFYFRVFVFYFYCLINDSFSRLFVCLFQKNTV